MVPGNGTVLEMIPTLRLVDLRMAVGVKTCRSRVEEHVLQPYPDTLISRDLS